MSMVNTAMVNTSNQSGWIQSKAEVGWVGRAAAIGHWPLARAGGDRDDHGLGGPWAGCLWAWMASADGTAVGKCGHWRGRPRAKEYSTSSSLSKNKV